MPSRRGAVLAVLVVAVLAGCGGRARKLDDGRWYGRLVSVDVAHRRAEVAPACELRGGRWVAAPSRSRATNALAARPELEVYVRPPGGAAAGHAQRVDLPALASLAARARGGWFVTVRGGTIGAIAEDSGIGSSGPADRRTFACVRSAGTQAFVGR